MTGMVVWKDELEKIKRYNENLKWFQAHYLELTDNYNGEYIAINNNQPIDHDRNVHALMKRLKKEYEQDLSSFVIERVHIA
jgi:thymidylate kinase